MKNKLLSFAAVLCIALLSIIPGKVKANHAAGGEIIYTHLGDSSYQFILKFYRDCRGPEVPNSFLLCIYNSCTNQSFTLPMPKWTGTLPPDNRANGSTVSPGCSNSSTTCEVPGSQTPGYREWWYTCVVTNLPLKCNSWKFACIDPATNSALCCRNSSTNLVGTPLFYIETVFNSSQTWNNNSPYYSVKPIPYVCLNRPFSFNMGAIDQDGDSLWSQLINPLATTSCGAAPTNAPIVQGLNPPINFVNNPFQTGGSFTLNGNNGQMSFTSTVLGGGALSIRTKEYRKVPGQATYEIGSIMRDVQIQTIICTTTPPVLDTVSINDSGQFLNNKVYGCIGQTLEFCFEVTSSDTDAVIKAEDNLQLSIPGATIIYTGIGTDTVKGCFKWTPTANDVGNHNFLLVIKDSTCKPPGILFTYVHTVDLEIWGPVEATADTSICSGEPAFLGVTGGGNYQWTVLSGSPNSLSSNSIPNPVATPTTTTTYLVTSTINPYCPDFNKDTVEIEVLKGPAIVGQADDTTCPGYTFKMDAGIIKQPGVTYAVNWTPATGLSSATDETPDVKLKTTQQYVVEIVSSDNRCKTLDTVLIDVLTGLTLENPDTEICSGQSVALRGVGDARYTYFWNTKDSKAIYSDPTSLTTVITPGDTGFHTYTVTGQFYKCIGHDTITNIRIDVQPNPTATIDDDTRMCFGDTMQMNAIINPNTYNGYTYSWTPGAVLDFPDRKNPIFSAVTEGITTLKFVVSTSAGCSDSDEVELNVFAADFMTLPADTAICPGDTISLAMQVQTGTKFYWLPDYNISSTSSLQPRIWPVANQLYTAYGVDSFGCLDTGEVMIAVRPRAVIDMPDSVIIYPGESYQMDPGGNCLYYTWFPPLGLSNADVSNPSISPKVNTRYVVNGRNEAGCFAIDSVDVLVMNDGYIKLPNAFTPGSRNNGTFKIIKRGIADLKTFAVYNRWGTKVFETSDINQGWDGTFNGEAQPVGAYVYTVEAVSAAGNRITKQGNVTLIR